MSHCSSSVGLGTLRLCCSLGPPLRFRTLLGPCPACPWSSCPPASPAFLTFPCCHSVSLSLPGAAAPPGDSGQGVTPGDGRCVSTTSLLTLALNPTEGRRPAALLRRRLPSIVVESGLRGDAWRRLPLEPRAAWLRPESGACGRVHSGSVRRAQRWTQPERPSAAKG